MAGRYDSPGPVSSGNLLLLRPRSCATACIYRERKRLEPPHLVVHPLGFTCVTAALNGCRATIRRRAYRDFVSWLLSTSLKNTRVLQHVKYCLCQTRPLPPKEKVERFLVATLQRFVRWYLFARSSRPLLLRLCKSILKTGRGRGSWNDTTSVFPRNSRATFRSLYGVRNFWGACRSRGFVEGNTLRFFFERFDRFNNCWYRWT